MERVWAWKERYGSQIIEQFKRLGASCDYERERFTLDEGYVRAVYRVFVALYERGLIYRDNYMVNWDPGSALGDLRPRGREPRGHRHDVRDRLPARGGRRRDHRRDGAPGDDARRHGGGGEPGRRALQRRWSATHCVLPLVGRRLPIIADEYVDPEFGTGALKITPGHDPNDFEIGRRHGLDEVTVIGEDGRMTAEAGERFAGLTIEEAQKAVVEALRERGADPRRAPLRPTRSPSRIAPAPASSR